MRSSLANIPLTRVSALSFHLDARFPFPHSRFKMHCFVVGVPSVGRALQRSRCCTRQEWRRQRPAVVFVTPRGICNSGERGVELCEAAIRGGASWVQLRDRGASELELDAMLHLLLERVDASLVIMNGSVAKGGVGLHIREMDMNSLLGIELDGPVGVSVHSVASAQKVMRLGMPNYIQVGTMYATRTHPGMQANGPGLMREVRDSVGEKCTLIGVGGIDAGNCGDVVKAGADGVAVIRAIAEAKDVELATREIVAAVQEARGLTV